MLQNIKIEVKLLDLPAKKEKHFKLNTILNINNILNLIFKRNIASFFDQKWEKAVGTATAAINTMLVKQNRLTEMVFINHAYKLHCRV